MRTPEDALAPDGVAHHVHRLVHEGHALLEEWRRRSGRRGGSPARSGSWGRGSPCRWRARCRRGLRTSPGSEAARELLERLLDFRQSSSRGERAGEMEKSGGGTADGAFDGRCEIRGSIRDRLSPAMPELGEQRHVVCVGGGRHALVHRHDAVVEACERERHVAVVVRHGMAGDHDADAALRAFPARSPRSARVGSPSPVWKCAAWPVFMMRFFSVYRPIAMGLNRWGNEFDMTTFPRNVLGDANAAGADSGSVRPVKSRTGETATRIAQCEPTTDTSPRCSTIGRKSRSENSNGSPSSMQKEPMMTPVVLRTVTPALRSSRYRPAARCARSRPRRSKFGNFDMARRAAARSASARNP